MTRAKNPATHDPAAIRGRLIDLIEADGRTQTELAERAGMSKAQLHQVLSGRRADASGRTIGRILAAMGLPWAALDRDRPA